MNDGAPLYWLGTVLALVVVIVAGANLAMSFGDVPLMNIAIDCALVAIGCWWLWRDYARAKRP